jgi:ketosteroid isomerase-like protein
MCAEQAGSTRGYRSAMTHAVEQFLEMCGKLNRRDFDGVYAMMHPEHRQFVNGSLVASDRASSRAADEVFYAMFPTLERIVDDAFGSDHQVASRSRWIGTTAEGRTIEFHMASMVTLRDGQFAESHIFLDPTVFG